MDIKDLLKEQLKKQAATHEKQMEFMQESIDKLKTKLEESDFYHNM